MLREVGVLSMKIMTKVHLNNTIILNKALTKLRGDIERLSQNNKSTILSSAKKIKNTTKMKVQEKQLSNFQTWVIWHKKRKQHSCRYFYQLQNGF